MLNLFACTGYVANFRVDVRDGSSIADMMRYVIDQFNVPGIKVYADNLFVTVEMLRWCRMNGVNLCGTTRYGRGFPEDLTDNNLVVGLVCVCVCMIVMTACIVFVFVLYTTHLSL